MKAEDVLPDNINSANFGDMQIRKGTIAAFLSNAMSFSNSASSSEQRQQAQDMIIEALPALKALHVFDVLTITDTNLRAVIDQHMANPGAGPTDLQPLR